MRWFQLSSAIILIIAIIGIVWINRSPLPAVQLVYIEQSGFAPMNERFIKVLEAYVAKHSRLSLKILPNQAQQLQDWFSAKQRPQSVVLGCFTGTCKMQVLDTLEGSIIPFLFVGRSHGLVKEPNLWHLGPLFSQTFPILLPLISNRPPETVHLMGEQTVDSHMNHYMLKQYLIALDYQWGQSLLMTNNNQDVIEDVIASTSDHIYINTACGEPGRKIYRWIDESLQQGIHTCLDPVVEKGQSEHWFISYSENVNESQLISSWAYLKAALDTQLHRERWSFSSLAGFVFFSGENIRVMDIHNQHVWHNQFLFFKSGGQLVQRKVINRIEPIIFPELKQKTEWALRMQLYWRNKNGRWQSI